MSYGDIMNEEREVKAFPPVTPALKKLDWLFAEIADLTDSEAGVLPKYWVAGGAITAAITGATINDQRL